MDVSTSFTKSNVIINQDTITTQKIIGSILSSNNTKTSTPCNDENKINKNSVAFNFVSPPNYASMIDSSSINNNVNDQSSSTLEYHDLRHRNSRLKLNDPKRLEAELKLKESYLKQLKSIDVAKYSFPNE
jgi:hypothetical protein